MDTKRPLQNTTQYQSNGHRVNTGFSKTQVTKNVSSVSLSPSQAAEQAKINDRKHPLDALSKLPNKQSTVERRSGLQDVDEEYLKQNIFRKPFYPRNSGLYDQNQMANTPVAGQPSIPPSERYITNQTASHAQLKSPQENYQQQAAVNLTPSQIQMQSQVQSATVTMPQQQNQQTVNAKNQIINSTMSTQHDLHNQQQQQINSNHCGQPPTHVYNNILPTSEPEMCTTCPNCQATIYLVRSADVNHDMTQQLSNNGDQQTVGDTVAPTSAGSA